MILRRSVNGRLSEIQRVWEGATVVLLGGGPSLTPAQVAIVAEAHERRKVRCIAVNDAYLIAPFADVLYFADAQWWRWHAEGIDKPKLGLSAAEVRERLEEFRGERCSLQTSIGRIVDDRMHYLRNKHYPHHGEGISLEQDALVTGKNSGFQALNFAILTGAARVLLLGYDGRPAIDGTEHWHGGHPRSPHPEAWRAIRASFDAAERAIEKAGLKVFNCSPGSQIGFRRAQLQEVISL